ncbi:MAG: TolC family protein [Phycisphaerales bacterium]
MDTGGANLGSANRAFPRLIMAALTAVTVAGCSSPFDDARYEGGGGYEPIHWRVAPDTVTRDQVSPPGTDHPDSQPGLTDVSARLNPDAGPEAYVRLALERNPAIRAAELRIERLNARVPQITSWDDPMLEVAPFGEMAQTAAGQVGLMSSVSQKLPYPGKLDTRGRIAQRDVMMATAELHQVRLNITAETRKAYWGYYFTTRALETTRESRQLLDQFRQIAEAEYKAGNRSQPDVLRASVELGNVDNELIVLQQRQATSASMLNQLLDRPVGAPLPEPVTIEPARVDADLDALLRTAALHNPAIAIVAEKIEQYRQQRELAKLNRRPDLTVSATYNIVDDEGLSMAANGDDQWWFGFGINLPFWAEKLDAAEREALRGMMENAAGLAAEKNRVAFGVQEAYLRLEAQQKLVSLFRDTIVPQARQTVDASASGYSAGTVDFLTLIDNWRKLLNFDLMYHRAVADLGQAMADLQHEVGDPTQPFTDAAKARKAEEQTMTTPPTPAREEPDR